MGSFFTEDSVLHFFATVAELAHKLQARGTVTGMALHSAVVAASQLLKAGTSAGWQGLSTLDWRFKLRNVARAVDRLDGNPLTRLTVAQVTWVRAIVLTTR